MQRTIGGSFIIKSIVGGSLRPSSLFIPSSRLSSSSSIPKFYSTQAEENRGDINELKRSLLDGSLKHVPKLGWSIEAISASAKELNLPGISHGLFPKGGYELVEHFVTKTNKQLALDFSGKDMSYLNLREKIAMLIKARLSPLAPHIKSGRWSEAMAALAHPTNASQSICINNQQQRRYHKYSNFHDDEDMLAVLSDEIWFHAGDTSVDFDWYTKRAMLAGIYTSAELYMLSDASEGFKDTWQFVDRRIDDLIAVSKFKYETEQAVSSAADTNHTNSVGSGTGRVITASTESRAIVDQMLNVEESTEELDAHARRSIVYNWRAVQITIQGNPVTMWIPSSPSEE